MTYSSPLNCRLTKTNLITFTFFNCLVSNLRMLLLFLRESVFLALSFYVQAAFERYNLAGQLWASDLRSACHSLAAQLFTLFSDGTFHEGDQRRVLAHLAAIPLILKNDVRGSRDTSEVRGLLSQDDIARMEDAESMANHCLDVIRSYYIGAITRKDLCLKDVVIGNRASFFEDQIENVEKVVRSLKFLDSFGIAPGFELLLNTLLGIWFLILPFALAEISGKFCPSIAILIHSLYS